MTLASSLTDLFDTLVVGCLQLRNFHGLTAQERQRLRQQSEIPEAALTSLRRFLEQDDESTLVFQIEGSQEPLVLSRDEAAYLDRLTRMGMEIEVNYRGGVSEYDTTPLTSALLKGILAPILGEDVNFVNAPYIAADRGIRVVESRTATSDDFASLIKVRVTSLEEENIVSGTIFGKTRPRILRINSFYLEAMPEGHLLFIHSLDVPGVIGRIASSLGARGVNIGRMHVGQQRDQEQNVILLSTDAPVDDRVLDEIRGFEQVFSVRPIEL